MAPSHSEFGAMVYLADVESRRVLRGPVGFIPSAFRLQTSTNAALELLAQDGVSLWSESLPIRSGAPEKFPKRKNEKRTLCLNKK